MIYIDASAYLAILLPSDINRKRAIEILEEISEQEKELITSYAVLGEVLTVASQRYNRQAAIDFVSQIHRSKTKLVLETQQLVDEAMELFKIIKNKNVSWVDCYSFAIIKQYKIKTFFSFDDDFKKHTDTHSLT